MHTWLKGTDMNIESELNGYVLIRNNGDFLGCGKLKNGKLLNYVPKARRLVVIND